MRNAKFTKNGLEFESKEELPLIEIILDEKEGISMETDNLYNFDSSKNHLILSIIHQSDSTRGKCGGLK